MSNFFNAIQTKDTLTANGAITHSTSLSNVLDLFFLCGACRQETEENIKIKLQKSWAEDKLLTLKIIFYAGDIREGLGERRFFRIGLKWLEENYKEVLEKTIELIPEYNRWDSLFDLDNDKILDFVYKNIDKNQLLAKWMPRRYNKKFEKFRIAFQKKYKLNDASYRKLIATASKTVEQQMSKKEWSDINYEAVPSVASNKYRKAFLRNDKERFEKFIEDVSSGDKKINASAIFPYDIYRAYKRGDNEKAIVAQWNSLPNYLENSNEKILPICDVSGSMSGTPMDISVSLGIYISERNNSVFKDGFITFSDNPKLQILKGTLTERIRQLEKAEWSMSTNFYKVFDLILSKARENNLKQDDMPTMLLCISDMEFDEASPNLTNFEYIKQEYARYEYILPKIVFWNVNGRVNNVPAQKNDDVILISGATPVILKQALNPKSSSIDIVKDILNKKRYEMLDNYIIQDNY